MPTLSGRELLDLSDEDFIKANADYQPAENDDSLLGSQEGSDTLDGDGDDPVDQGADDNANQDGSDGGGGTTGASDGDGITNANAEDDDDDDNPDGAADKSKDGTDPDDADATDSAKQAPKDAGKGVADADQSAKDKALPGGVKTPEQAKADDKAKPGETPADASKPMTPEDYKAFFEQVMKPFKANNKEVQVRTPEEAIRLMQMGAGYGKKMADLQPHLKVLRMLEKQGLINENKLSFLIELNSKNPKAIKQLLRDAKIDPMDLNMEEDSGYVAPSHSVSDAESNFKDILVEIRSQPNGAETIRHVNTTWDKPSLAYLFQNPQILQVIQTQRVSGVYDEIVSEMERMKMLGTINPKTPFIQAYKQAGDELVRMAGFDPNKAPQTQQTPLKSPPVALETKVGKTKPTVTNDSKAKAAGSSPSRPGRTPMPVDMLALSDDDFMKTFSNR